MDLKALTTEELDALQLAVNVEIGDRLQKARMLSRLTDAMESASVAGVPEAEIATSFSEARTRAKITYEEPVERTVAAVANSKRAVPDKVTPTPRRTRASSGFRTNTIDN